MYPPSVKTRKIKEGTYIGARDLQFISKQNKKYPVVRTYETVYFQNNEHCYYQHTLRIYEDKQQMQHRRTILLDVASEDYYS
jgi:hypothetical protein